MKHDPTKCHVCSQRSPEEGKKLAAQVDKVQKGFKKYAKKGEIRKGGLV